MPNRPRFNSPKILTACFVGGIVLVHALLWLIVPNKGMGTLGLMYIIWPLLIIWVALFFWLVSRYPQLKNGFLIFNFLLMTFLNIIFYPQDASTSFAEKVRAIGERSNP